MQIRCQHCSYMFTLSREAVTAAIEEMEQAHARHYAVTCPKCRHQIKVPAKSLRRFRPAKAPGDPDRATEES